MRFQERLSYANVVATLALVLAATGGGVAYAHRGKITSNEIKKNAVKSKHVKDNNVKSKDVKNGNLRGKDIRNGSLSGADVRNGSLGASDLTAKTRSGVAEAGVRFTSNGTLVSWFNRSGGPPDFIRGNGPGISHVRFPGTTPSDSIVTVTAWGPVGTICTMPFIQERGGLMTVVCVDEDGVPVNAAFSLVLHKS